MCGVINDFIQNYSNINYFECSASCWAFKHVNATSASLLFFFFFTQDHNTSQIVFRPTNLILNVCCLFFL